MNISKDFIKEILQKNYPEGFQNIFDQSKLLQYLDKKTGAIYGNSKTRRSLGNLYAIYSILYFYQEQFYNNRRDYKKFSGYDYTQLFRFYRSLYGGSKLQNHGLNSRVNGEFKNIVKVDDDLIISNDGKYLIFIDYLYVQGQDVSKTCCEIIRKYIELLQQKDHKLLQILSSFEKIKTVDEKKKGIQLLLEENAEARIFEIISYAILKNHYKECKVYFGYSQDEIQEISLTLYKTGRTNANDGGIDFVMRPIGRFFQVTEAGNYDKYLLDIDKVMHFPITFVIKTEKKKDEVRKGISLFIEEKSSGMDAVKKRYEEAIEEIITINELKEWIHELNEEAINSIIRDIDLFYKIEMDLETD